MSLKFPPGTPLAQAGGLPPRRDEVEIAAPLQAKAAKTGLLPDLGRILRPDVASRWLLPSSKQITPDYIETVLRGALTGSHVLQWELFSLMEDTWPRLAKNLNELKRAVIARDWRIEAWAEEDAPPTDSAEEKAKLVSRAVWTMRPEQDEDGNNFEGLIYDLLDAWAKGLSVLELDWETRSSGSLGEFNAPRAAFWVHPMNYGYDEQGRLGLNLAGANERGIFARQNNITPFPEDKFLVALCKSGTGSPLGAALLRRLAFWWCAANFSASWFLNFAQIFGLPIRWANYDPNTPGLLEKVLDMLENMGSAGYGAFPAGTTLELKEPAKAGTDNPQVAVLDRADTQCDILILGQTLTTATPTSGGGTRAQGEVHLSVRGDVIQAAADFVAGIINTQLVPMILRLNFPDDSEAPEFCPEEKRIEDAKANAERDDILLKQGVEMPKGWFYDRHNIPLPAEGEEVISGRPQSAPALPGGDPANPMQPMQAHDRAGDGGVAATLVDAALADATGIAPRWLGAVRPVFTRLMAKAMNDSVSDADFVAAIQAAQKELPDVFDRMDHNALARVIEQTMAAGVVNGAVRGALARKHSTLNIQRSISRAGGAA